MGEIGFIAAFIAGILSFLSPCVLPLVPPYLGYLSGFSLHQLADGKVDNKFAARRTLLAAIFFVLGFSVVFIGLGMTATVFGKTLARYMDVFRIVAGCAIILMGLHFLGLLKLKFLMKTLSVDLAGERKGITGAFLMGLAFAFGWTPCVGPILASVLFVAAGHTGSMWQGGALLAAYAAGIGVPFILVSLLAGPFLRFMTRFRKSMGIVEKLVGVFLILTGILFLTNWMSEIANWLINTFSFFQNIG